MGNASGKPQVKSRNKKQVRWKAADRPAPPGKPQLVPGNDVTPDVVTIRWDKPISDGGAPIVGYLVEHRRTGSPHWVRATPQLVPNPEVSLSGLEPGWRYQFRISAENAVGLSDPGELSEPLTVTLQRSAVTAPRFTEELKDLTAIENEKSEFVVHFLGQPPPKVCWFKDGFEIFSSRRTRITTEIDRSVLTFHQSALCDEGEIKCTATNRAGHASTKARLTLEAPPSIRLPRQYEEGLLFELDEVIRLKVSIAGRPTPLVFWSHNGESVQNDERYEIDNDDKSSTLRVGEAKRTDRGEYQIRAVNTLGEDIQSFLVTVTDKPLPPGKARVVMTLGRSVTLSWGMPDDDGGCKIGNYIVEYYRIGWNVWLKAATCRQLTTILGDLIEGSEYKFRIKAESPFGVSDPSEESDIIFIPDPKRGILQPPARQAPKVVQEEPPIASKRRPKPAPRSHSSSRVEDRASSPPETYLQIPIKPVRSKSPQKSASNSPAPAKKQMGADTIDRNFFDHSSSARELAYGSPEIKIKRTDIKHPPPEIALRSPAQEEKPKEKPKVAEKPVEKITKPVVERAKENPTEKPIEKEIERPKTVTVSTTGNHVSRLSPSRSGITMSERGRRSKSPSPQDIERRFLETEAKINAALSKSKEPTSPQSPKVQSENEDSLHGSSEFMLVLYPNDDKNKKDHGSTSEMGFEYDMFEIDVPPPMSLSAPELSTDIPLFIPLRTSISSSELLHERAMARFYQAVEAEEAELRKRRDSERRKSADGKIIEIPKIKIIDEDNSLERKASLRRRLSGGAATTQQVLWMQQKRQSLKNSGDLTEIPENTLHKFPDTLEARRELMMFRQRSASEEKEEEEFERVRRKMAEKTEADKINKANAQKKIDIAPVEEWEPENESVPDLEYEESISSEESEESEDERLKYDKVPEYVADEEEDEIYHPRMMIPRPTLPPAPPVNKEDDPFEILTRPNPLPDPNFVPKPILKRRPNVDDVVNKGNKIPVKIKPKSPSPEKSHRLSPGKRKQDKLSPQKEVKKSPSPKQEIPKKLSPDTDAEDKQKSPSSAPPTTRGSYGHIETTSVASAANLVGMSAAGVGLGKKLVPNKKVVEEETKTVIDLYGDIVKTYGHGKKQQTKSFLERGQYESVEKEDEELSKSPEPPKLLEITKTQEALKPKPNIQKQSQEVLVKSTTTLVEIAYAPVITKKEASYTNETLMDLQESDIKTLEEKRTRSPSPQKPWKKPLETFKSDSATSSQELLASGKLNGRRTSQETSSSQEMIEVGRPTGRRSATPIKKEQKRRSATPLRAEQRKRSETPVRTETKRTVAPSPMRTETYSRSSSTAQSPMRTPKSQSRSTSATRKSAASPMRAANQFKSNSLPRPMLKEIQTQTSIGYEEILKDRRNSAPQERTEAISAEAEVKVRTIMDYTTDLAMFTVACWFYLFSNELFAIPFLAVMGYRQLKDELRNRMPSWLKRRIYGADDNA